MGPHIMNRLVLLWMCFFIFRTTGSGQVKTLSSSYKIRHTSTARFFEHRKAIHTRDNSTILAGKWGSTQDDADLMVMKLNDRGEVVWAKRTVVNYRLDEYELTELSDGTVVFVGNSQYNPPPAPAGMLLLKFSCKGDLLWSRNLSVNASLAKNYLLPYSIREGKDNDVIIGLSGTVVGSQQHMAVVRVNSAGSLVWSKSFYGFDTQTNQWGVALYGNDKITVLGMNSFFSNGPNYNKSFFAMRLNYASGVVELIRGFNYSEFFTNYGVLGTAPKNHFYAEQLTNGGFALFGEFSNFDLQKAYYFKLLLRPDLSVDRSTAFSIPKEPGLNYSKIAVFPNGQTHIVSAVYDAQRFYWYAADSLLNTIREQKTVYPNTYIEMRYVALQGGPSRSMNILSTTSTIGNSTGRIEVTQTEDNDTRALPCLGTDTSFIKVLPWQVNSGSKQWSAIKDNEAVLATVSFTAYDIPVSSEFICEPNPGQPAGAALTGLAVSGMDTVCASALAQRYAAHAKGYLPGAVRWTLDSGRYGSLAVLDDSTVSATFSN